MADWERRWGWVQIRAPNLIQEYRIPSAKVFRLMRLRRRSVPLPRVNDIVREKRAISPEMAVLLSAYFGTSDGYWMNLQAHYDLEMAKDRVAKQAASIRPHPHDESGT